MRLADPFGGKGHSGRKLTPDDVLTIRREARGGSK